MVSLLDNGSCFRKVAPNTRSSEKSRITRRGHVSGCMASATPGGQKRPLLYSSPPRNDLLGRCPSLPSGIRSTCNRPSSVRESHDLSLRCPRYPRMCLGGTAVHARVPTWRCCRTACGLRARHARTVCMYEPIPTSSGWIAAAAQKLWSRGLRALDHRLCLGLLRGAQVVFRGY